MSYGFLARALVAAVELVAKPTRFESIKPGVAATITGFHWSLRPIQGVRGGVFFLCDDPNTWSWSGTQQGYLYEVVASVESPYVTLNQKVLFEKHWGPVVKKALVKAGFDSVVFTPDESVPGLKGNRQCVLLSPATQILSLTFKRTLRK